jgi:hypothetical protein
MVVRTSYPHCRTHFSVSYSVLGLFPCASCRNFLPPVLMEGIARWDGLTGQQRPGVAAVMPLVPVGPILKRIVELPDQRSQRPARDEGNDNEQNNVGESSGNHGGWSFL